MFSQVEASIKAKVDSFITIPMRWKNHRWGNGILLSDGGMPVDSNGVPVAAIEVEIILVEDISAVGIAGSGGLISEANGFVYFHISVEKDSGTSVLNTQIDLLWTNLKRRDVPVVGALTVKQLRIMDPVIDDDLIDYGDGNRFSRTIRFPWQLVYGI